MAAMDANAMRDRFAKVRSTFSTAQLIGSGALFVVALIGVMAFVKWAGAPTYTVLMSGLDAKDASSITAKLQSDGVPYKLSGGGSTVMVPAGAVDKERLSLAAAGLPKGSTEGWDVLDKQGITSSSFQQQVAYQRALEGQLASTLSQLDGVTDAQVHLAIPTDQLFTDSTQTPRAAVMLGTAGTLSDETVQSVMHLVASAVPNLDPAAVTVTDSRGELLSDTSSASGSSRSMNRVYAYEDQLAARAQSMLDQILGPGHAVVRVNATMDSSTQSTDTEVYDPKQTATLAASGSKENYTGAAASNAASGVVSANPTSGTSSGSSSGGTYTKTDTANQYGVSKTVTHTQSGPGAVKRLAVSTVVDSNAKNSPAVAAVQALVANAVGLDPKRGDTISVQQAAFPVVTPSKTVAPKTSMLTSIGGGGATKTISTVVAVILLVLVALGFLRVLKHEKVQNIPLSQVEQLTGGSGRAAIGSGSTGALVHHAGSRGDPRSALLDHVEQHPDEIAAVLRNWLSSTGTER